MRGDSGLLASLARRLEGAAAIDEIAGAALRTLTQVGGVTRAGLALAVVGGRQLRFASSDLDRLGPPVEWCLIDAFDSLPLNDAVRTGREVILGTPARFDREYPELAAHHRGSGVESVVALSLSVGGQRIGGLLVYRDRVTPAAGDEAVSTLREIAGQVGAALAASADAGGLTSAEEWAPEPPAAAVAEVSGNAHSTLPADATAPGNARRFVQRTLEGWHFAQGVVDAAVLCASELVTNVVVHVRQPSVITVERHDATLTVAVHQPRATAEEAITARDRPDVMAIAGRGLTLVHALSSRWGSEPTSDGTRVWFQIDAAG